MSQLKAQQEQLATAQQRIGLEIEQIEGSMAVLRRYAVLQQLPGVDEDLAAPYGDLTSQTVPEACATILRKRGGEPATARELLKILVAAGKLQQEKESTHVSVIAALKRHPELFQKVGNAWTLAKADSNGQQAVVRAFAEMIEAARTRTEPASADRPAAEDRQ